MIVVERVPHPLIRGGTDKEPIEVRCVDALKNSVMHRSRLVSHEFRRRSKVDGFTNLSGTLPLEFVKLTMQLVATCDRAAWFY